MKQIRNREGAAVSKARERAYERRRYEEWQKNLADRKRKRRQTQQIVAAVVSSIAALAVIVGVTLLVTTGGDDDSDTTAAAPSASASASAPASASASASAAPVPVKGGCTPSKLPAIASPKQVTSVPKKSVAAGKTFSMVLNTTCGAVTVELDGKAAPQAVASTITLARDGFYDKTPCHRLTTSGIYVLQCGDPTGKGTGGPGYQYGPLENIPKSGIYKAGVVAMARGQEPATQGSQFFLVYQDTELPAASTNGGYTVIGKITKGLDVVKKVAKSGANPEGDGAPVTAVSITSAKVTEG